MCRSSHPSMSRKHRTARARSPRRTYSPPGPPHCRSSWRHRWRWRAGSAPPTPAPAPGAGTAGARGFAPSLSLPDAAGGGGGGATAATSALFRTAAEGAASVSAGAAAPSTAVPVPAPLPPPAPAPLAAAVVAERTVAGRPSKSRSMASFHSHPSFAASRHSRHTCAAFSKSPVLSMPKQRTNPSTFSSFEPVGAGLPVGFVVAVASAMACSICDVCCAAACSSQITAASRGLGSRWDARA